MFKIMTSLLILLLLAGLASGCGSSPATEDAATPVPETATSIAVGATNTPPPPTATPVPNTPTPVPPAETATAPPTETATPLPAHSGSGGGVIAYCYQPMTGRSLHQIYAINLDGSDNRKLIEATIGLNHHDWSPDGTRMAAVGYASDTTWSIYVFDVGSDDLTRLTYKRDVWDSEPIWSPDGTQIAFTRIYPDRDSREELWLMNADGSDRRWIGVEGFAARWSPDGSRLIYTSNRTGNYEIYTVNVDGTDERRMTDTSANETFPTWSPDGRQIAYAASTGAWNTPQNTPTYELYVMEPDGTQVRQLTDNDAYDGYPRWSPDGTRLAFNSDRAEAGHWEVYVMRADGSDVRQVTHTPSGATAINPVWRPAPAGEAAAAAASEAGGGTWFKTYGGRGNEVCNDALLAADGGLYLVGVTGLEFQPEQQGDVHLIRTDASGEVLWERTYGGPGYDGGSAVVRTGDGGLLISGATNSWGGGGMDFYLVKVDLDGNELWSRTFGGPLDEVGAAWPLPDGGFMLGGNLVDPDDVVISDPGTAGYAGFGGRSNAYLARIDDDGNEMWSRTFGGEGNVMATAGLPAPDGGFVILATILGFPEADDDIYLVKVDENGNEVWSRTWEPGMSSGYGLAPAADGGYLVTGPYSPADSMDRAVRDFLFVRFDGSGNEVWMSTFGDDGAIDYAQELAVTADGGYVAAGQVEQDLVSWDADIVLVKIDERGQLLWERTIETDAHSMFGALLQHADGGYVIAGSIFNGHDFDVFAIKTDGQGQVAP